MLAPPRVRVNVKRKAKTGLQLTNSSDIPRQQSAQVNYLARDIVAVLAHFCLQHTGQGTIWHAANFRCYQAGYATGDSTSLEQACATPSGLLAGGAVNSAC